MVVATAAVTAQEPPTVPVRPAPATAPTPRPATPLPALPPTHVRIPDWETEEIRRNAAEIARVAREASLFDREHSRAIAEAAREASREAMELNREHVRAATEWAREQSRFATEAARDQARAVSEAAREIAHITPMHFDFAPMTAMAPMAPMRFDFATPMPAPMVLGRAGEDFRLARPWFGQGEPEDSLYRIAHDLLNRGDYGRAAQMFKDITAKYPKSRYETDLPYYEAYARYKIGTTDELRNAARLLEPRASKLIGVVSTTSSSTSYNNFGRRTSEGDVAALYIRINSVLASRGDNNAAGVVARAAQAGANTCDREDMQVRVEAMSALSQMDAAAALPLIRRVLDKKDDCTEELRKRAVFMLGRRGDADAAALLAQAAKSDPSTSVRTEAISWLPKVQGDAGVNMLEQLLREETDERIQRSVVRTLVSSENARARTSMRALIDRKDAPISLRIEAVNSFNSERATNDDAAYLRGLYTRADNDRLKESIINALARIGGSENDQWVMNIARNQNEPSQLRAAAISRLMRSNIAIADLSKLYDASDSYDVRSRIVSVLENRKEPEAADKLYDIVKNSTVVNIRNQALNALTRKKDPRSVQLLQDIIEGKRP
jgi:HEAT repeat protein/TolA-binding protein